MKQTLKNKLSFLISHAADRAFSKSYKSLRRLKIVDNLTTIDLLSSNNPKRFSISRFGDGEITLMAGNDTDFQKKNPIITEKMRKILQNETTGLLVGLPSPWLKPWNLKYYSIEFWAAFLDRSLNRDILPTVNFQSTYYDSFFTRFYMDYRSPKNAKKVLSRIKNIWHDRDICFIEGEFSRLGVGNDLFDNAKSVKRILCPAKDAFNIYDLILETAQQQPKDTLFLLALGMTATVLAYDLHILGYQAIDIGHVDIEYEWFRMGAKKKCIIPTKFVAEVVGNNPVKTLEDHKYQNEIITNLSKY